MILNSLLYRMPTGLPTHIAARVVAAKRTEDRSKRSAWKATFGKRVRLRTPTGRHCVSRKNDRKHVENPMVKFIMFIRVPSYFISRFDFNSVVCVRHLWTVVPLNQIDLRDTS